MMDTFNKLESLIREDAPGRLREKRCQVRLQVKRDLAAHRFEAVGEALKAALQSGDKQLAQSIRDLVDRHIADEEHRAGPAYREERRQERLTRKREDIVLKILVVCSLSGFLMSFAWSQFMSPPIYLSVALAVGFIVVGAGAEFFANLYVGYMPEALQPLRKSNAAK